MHVAVGTGCGDGDTLRKSLLATVTEAAPFVKPKEGGGDQGKVRLCVFVELSEAVHFEDLGHSVRKGSHHLCGAGACKRLHYLGCKGHSWKGHRQERKWLVP